MLHSAFLFHIPYKDNTKTQRSNLGAGWGYVSIDFALNPKKWGPKPKPKPEEKQMVAKRKPGLKPRKYIGNYLIEVN